MNSMTVEKELMVLFPDNVIPINQYWISQAEDALNDVFRKDITQREIPLKWTATDINWEGVITWLRTATEHFENATAHYILLWLVCDKVHGFWNRKRERSLDTVEMINNISWAMNARIGVVDALLGAAQPISGPNIGGLFRNPLLFRMNPKVALLPKNSKLSEMETVLNRAWDILSMPIQLEQIEKLQASFITHHKSVQRIKEPGVVAKRWVELVQGRNPNDAFFSVECLDLFDILYEMATKKQLKNFDSPQMVGALCSYWKEYIQQANKCWYYDKRRGCF